MLGILVEGNHVDLGRNPTDQTGRGDGILHPVVDIANEHVLEGDPSAALEGEAAQLGHQVRQGIAPCDGHQLLPSLLVRRIEGNGEFGPAGEIGQPPYPWKNTRCGDRDSFGAHPFVQGVQGVTEVASC